MAGNPPPPILIETHVTDALHHTCEVLNGSLRVPHWRVGVPPRRQDQRRQHGSDDPHDVPLSWRPVADPLLAHAAIAPSRAPSGKSSAAPAAPKVCAAAARWWPGSEAKIQTKSGRPSPGRSPDSEAFRGVIREHSGKRARLPLVSPHWRHSAANRSAWHSEDAWRGLLPEESAPR